MIFIIKWRLDLCCSSKKLSEFNTLQGKKKTISPFILLSYRFKECQCESHIPLETTFIVPLNFKINFILGVHYSYTPPLILKAELFIGNQCKGRLQGEGGGWSVWISEIFRITEMERLRERLDSSRKNPVHAPENWLLHFRKQITWVKYY